MKLTVLSGGTGTPKLLEGLESLVGQYNLNVIVNTSDDFWYYGLYISPDVDSVTYLFSNLLDKEKYWGIKDDTFNSFNMLKRYGLPEWFHLGDRDLAVHIYRTYLLREGYTLTEVTKYIADKLGVKAKVIPMCNEHVETYVLTEIGKLHIQEYLVKYRFKPKVYGIMFPGIERAKATSEVLKAIRDSEAIVLGPSNPINSIGPILAVKPVRREIKKKLKSGTPIVAVSPMVGSKALSGPAHIFMEALGYEPTPYGISQIYSDIISDLIVHHSDSKYVSGIEKEFGINVHLANVVMNTLDDKVRLARKVLNICKSVEKS